MAAPRAGEKPDGGAQPAPPTIHDVAREAGVSIGTVSRVLNERRDVAPDTRAKVLAAAKRIRYMPQLTTRRLSIGLVLQDAAKAPEVSYVASLIYALARQANRRGAVLELVPLKELDTVYQHYLRGLIAVLFGDAAARLRAITHIPVMFINHKPSGAGFHAVATDHAQGARIATEHLLSKGHRRIVFLEIERTGWGARERERGYREAFAAARARVPEDLVAYLDGRSIQTVFDPLLKESPTALLACGEDLSLAMYDELVHRLKLAIPGQLSVVGYEIPVVSRMMTPPMTTVAQPWEEIARVAVEGMLSLIAGRATGRLNTILPNTLIERSSVLALP